MLPCQTRTQEKLLESQSNNRDQEKKFLNQFHSTNQLQSVSLDLEGVMIVAASLIPCFEGALGDSDELVKS